MPEANTMETAKTELVESFIKYITGVYLLQQEFIDDMQGGLQSVLEKYNVTSVNEQLDNMQEKVESVAPKKTRKKSTKKEDTEQDLQVIEPVEPTQSTEEIEETKDVEPVEPVKPVEPVEPVEPVKPVEPVEPVKPVESVETNVSIPSHISSALNTEEKKTRKPRAKKGETSEEPKKKRLTSAYNVFLTEYSKNPELKGTKIGERKQLASPIWDKIKEDSERFREYQEKADAINKENSL